MSSISVRTEEHNDTSTIVIGPWPDDRRHDVLGFSAQLFNDGITHVVVPVDFSLRVPLETLTFEQITQVVRLCAELTRT